MGRPPGMLRGVAIVVGLTMALAIVSPGASSSFGEAQRLLAADAAAGDFFGLSVSVSGNAAIVGAAGSDVGAAHVFQRDAVGWSHVAKLTGADGEAGDFFGLSVSIRGDEAIAGAPGEDAQGADAGAAYIFQRGADGWSQVARLVASDAEAGDEFGYSVAIDGDTAVVGAFFEDTAGDNAGAAYVFERRDGDGGAWVEVAKLTAAETRAGAELGISVAIDGDTIVVGAIHEAPAGVRSGAARVFQRDEDGPGNWGEAARLAPADGRGGDRFGSSVAVDGDTIVVGAFFNDAAYVFHRDPRGWDEGTRLFASDAGSGAFYGSSVAIDGDTVVVGASRADDGAISDSGAAYVYERDADGWVETKQLASADLQPGDSFGDGVAIGAGVVVVGASSSDTGGQDAGAVYLFDRSGDLPGDVDCDGVVSVIDAALLLQLDAGLLAALPCPANGDANADGRSDAGDAAIILRMRAGLDPS